MIVRNEGYTREEIDAVVDTISVMGNAPLRLRMTVSASAEGDPWTEVEEWTLLSANRFVSHSEGDPRTTHYVKCQPTGS